MKHKLRKHNTGFAIVEFLFYISILAMLVLVLINALITMTRSFKETTIYTQLQSGNQVFERITRSIKQASSITAISASDLVLVTKDLNNNNQNVQFVLSGNNINYLENGASVGNLNSPSLVVTALSFAQVTTTKGTGVKISMSVRSVNDTQNRVESFYDTIVLRGDY